MVCPWLGVFRLQRSDITGIAEGESRGVRKLWTNRKEGLFASPDVLGIDGENACEDNRLTQLTNPEGHQS